MDSSYQYNAHNTAPFDLSGLGLDFSDFVVDSTYNTFDNVFSVSTFKNDTGIYDQPFPTHATYFPTPQAYSNHTEYTSVTPAALEMKPVAPSSEFTSRRPSLTTAAPAANSNNHNHASIPISHCGEGNQQLGTSFFMRNPDESRGLRTAQACEKCRVRKAKCNGESPCGRCTSRGLECVYAPERRMRGPNRSQKRKASTKSVASTATTTSRKSSAASVSSTSAPNIKRDSSASSSYEGDVNERTFHWVQPPLTPPFTPEVNYNQPLAYSTSCFPASYSVNPQQQLSTPPNWSTKGPANNRRASMAAPPTSTPPPRHNIRRVQSTGRFSPYEAHNMTPIPQHYTTEYYPVEQSPIQWSSYNGSQTLQGGDSYEQWSPYLHTM